MKKAKLVLLILMVLLAIAGLVVTFKPLMIEENGRTLLIAPHAQKDFKSHEVPDPVYAGSSSLEINSLRLCSLVAKLHGWDRERSYLVPGKYSTEHNVVIFRLYEAETIERVVSS